MDCELFDKLVIDRVFSELDDLTSGSVQRHVAHCSRCRSIESSLRAAREVTCLATVEPPASFVEQVLTLERATRTQLPWKQRLGRAISVLAGYAMRPQLGMSALLLLMIGLSLLFLRTQPGERELIHVTERGVPEGEIDSRPDGVSTNSVAQLDSPTGRAQRATSERQEGPSASNSSEPLYAARHAFENGQFALAQELAEKMSSQDPGDLEAAALLSAVALWRRSGCSAAVARFEALRLRSGTSSVGAEAAFRTAECHLETGHTERARELYLQLQNNPVWGAQARARLKELPTTSATDGGAVPQPAEKSTP